MTRRTILHGLASYYLLSGLFMWVAPQLWFDAVPGVAMTGGYNSHFIRDIAITFGVSAAALWLGTRHNDARLASFGAAWPCAHAAFHIWIWIIHRHGALDLVTLSNLIGIQLPAWVALAAARGLSTQEPQL